MIQNKIKINNIRNYFTALLAFTLPLNKSLVPPLIIINLLLWCLEGNWQKKRLDMNNTLFILSVAFYLWHLVGLFYTSNLKAGNFDVVQKLSLIIFPCIFLLGPKIKEENYNFIFKSFVIGCFFSSLICLGNSIYKFYITNSTDAFFYGEFSAILHTSYFALYLNLAVVLLLFNNSINHNKWLNTLLICYFGCLIILIASKSGIFSLIITILFKMIFDFKVNKRYTQTLIFFLGLIFSIIIIQHTYPKVFERLVEMEKDINQPNQELNTTSSRISIWKHAYDIITHNIVFGVGTGDVKDALKEEYLQNKEFKMAEKQLNAHNQYLQTFVALGLIGTVFLLLNLALVFIYTVKAKVIEGALFSLLVAFNLLFESMLETQAGIVFIAFFLTLFLDISKQHLIAKSTIIAS